MVAPLTDLLGKNIPETLQEHWTSAQEQAIEELKQALTNSPVLCAPDFTKTFVVKVDACRTQERGIGAILLQPRTGGTHDIAQADKNGRAQDRERECKYV